MPDSPVTTEQQQLAEEEYRRRCPSSFGLFSRGLIIKGAQGPVVFKRSIADYQRRDFGKIAPSLHDIQQGNKPKQRRFWLERTKKAGKDSDLGLMLLWLVAFATRPLLIQVVAADQGQAGVTKDRITDLLHYNQWLNDYVQVQRNRIVNVRGIHARIIIEPTETAGAPGPTPDVLVLNELVHVAKWDAMEAHMSNASGVPRSVIFVVTNAGYEGTKAFEWRKGALASGSPWEVLLRQKPAPWITEEDLRDEEARLSKAQFQRLWYGKWASGKGDAIDPDLLELVFDQKYKRHNKRRDGATYIGALDIGVKHDHCGLICLGMHLGKRKLRVANLEWFTPDKTTGEVDLGDVRATVAEWNRLYGFSWFGFDPYQAALMAQDLRKMGVPMAEVGFSSQKTRTMMAVSLVQVIEDRLLKSFPSKRLKADIQKFSIIEKGKPDEVTGLPPVYQLAATSDASGHADVGTALVIALPKALEIMGISIRRLQPDEDIAHDGELIDDEDDALETMPDELREIIEAYTTR